MPRTLVLVGGDDRFHDSLAAGEAFYRILNDAWMPTRISADYGRLCRPQGDADVYVTGAQMPPLTPEQQAGLLNRINAGSGLVAIHGANAVHDDHLPGLQPWLQIVGSRFINHPPYGDIHVRIVQDHPITQSINDFHIEDELYHSIWVEEPGLVLAEASGAGGPQPMVYVRNIGKGRVCYIALGHDARVWYHPIFRRLLVQAVNWASAAA